MPTPSSSSQTPAISIVMPCYNRAYDLRRVLQAYDLQNTDQPFEIIAVDDASRDDTFDVLQGYKPSRYHLRIYRMDTNSGPAAARNRAISEVRSPLILIVGDDILPDPQLVQGHLAAHRVHPEPPVAILGKVEWPADMPVNTLMRHIDGIGAQQFSYHYLQDGQPYDFRHFYTANISIKKEFLFANRPWFDTDFRYAAFEDAELAYRLSKSGLKIIYRSLLKAYHYHYYNIWTFSQRQYRIGLMAGVLIEKHPELTRLIRGRRWPWRTLLWRILASFQSSQTDHAESIEQEAMHLASTYEWARHDLLDRLYLRILDYFYFKGLLFGLLGESLKTAQLCDVYARRALKPAVRWFAP